MKRIIIVGGGFAGLRVARGLRNVPGAQVLLVSEDPDFRYTPALYRTATGGRKRQSSLPIAELIADLPNVRFKQARIARIDRASRTLTDTKGQKYHYDYCVLALGVVTSYFGIPGLQEFSYSIKTAHEVERLKRHLHDHLINENALDKNYVIVGGGPTGVELAAALGAYIKRIARGHKLGTRRRASIELIEALPRILPTMSPRASKLAAKRLRALGVKLLLKSKVGGETKTSLQVDGRTIPTHTVIWTAGVTNNPFFKANADQFVLDPRGKVIVDTTLRVDAHHYVIGDNAVIPFGGLAQTAVTQGRYTARSLAKLVRYGVEPKPFRPRKPIYAVPVGERNAVVEAYGYAFDGKIGALMRAAADLIGYADIMGYYRAFRLWMHRDDYEESCPVCKAPRVTP